MSVIERAVRAIDLEHKLEQAAAATANKKAVEEGTLAVVLLSQFS